MTPIQKAELLAFVEALEPVAAPAPVPVPPPPPSWVDVAAEGTAFNLDTPTRVRYGAGSSWSELDLPAGSNYCGNVTFGGDPAPNIAKTCQVQTGAPAPTPAPPAPTPPPPPPPAPTPPAPPPGPAGTLYFSQEAGASNANAGTQASPKRDLGGINLNTLAGGTTLLFRRGDTWTGVRFVLENLNTSTAAPLVFDAYGTGTAPCFQTTNENMLILGGYWGNTSNDGGYIFRNLKFDGMGTAQWGVWFVQNVRDVTFENCEITRFGIGMNSSDAAPHGVTGLTVRNCNLHHNSDMALLGHYNDLVFEGNIIESNNFGGSTFSHGTYIGGGHNITIRNNQYIRNSVVNGICTGGNMTFHGQIDDMLIEGNTIEQDASAPGGWAMSITQAYFTAEWFRNLIVRNNTIINSGNVGMNVQLAPDVLIEGNTIINRQGTTQTAISVGVASANKGDDADGNAIVRNNIIRRANGSSGTPVQFTNAPGSVSQNNVVVLE